MQGQLNQAKQQLTGQLNNLANNVLTVEPAARPSNRSSPAATTGSRLGHTSSISAQAQVEALEATAAIDAPDQAASSVGGAAFDDISLDGSAPSSPAKGHEITRLQQENRQLKQRLQQVQDTASEALGACVAPCSD